MISSVMFKLLYTVHWGQIYRNPADSKNVDIGSCVLHIAPIWSPQTISNI